MSDTVELLHETEIQKQNGQSEKYKRFSTKIALKKLYFMSYV